MSAAPVADRLVEVITDLGVDVDERYTYGSGCVVGGRTVLTSAHVVAGAQHVEVRNLNKQIFNGATRSSVHRRSRRLALGWLGRPRFGVDIHRGQHMGRCTSCRVRPDKPESLEWRTSGPGSCDRLSMVR